MKNTDINIATLKRQFTKILSPIAKHLTLIVILLALLAVIITVYKMETILTQTEDKAYETQAKSKNAVKTRFDQATIDKIKKLRDPNSSSGAPALPSGRINPFIS